MKRANFKFWIGWLLYLKLKFQWNRQTRMSIIENIVLVIIIKMILSTTSHFSTNNNKSCRSAIEIVMQQNWHQINYTSMIKLLKQLKSMISRRCWLLEAVYNISIWNTKWFRIFFLVMRNMCYFTTLVKIVIPDGKIEIQISILYWSKTKFHINDH